MSSLDIATFATFAATSGSAPRIAVNSGACFAGNAVLFGCADVTIATRSSSIGMAGPVMIEAGGLGSYRTEEVGPIDVQAANGVVDVVVEDEIEGVAVAKQVLSYFQGSIAEWECADQRHLRHVIPENRKRVYDMRTAIDLLADTGSVLELRRHYGVGIITAFVRIEGRPFGLYANDPMHLGGAIDAEGAEKAARFMQLCDAFDIPLVSLCDTPGFMVGPDAEKEATVRRASRMMVVGANLTVPVFMVCLRKGYGLGAQGMGGGSFHSPFFNISWPTGEFGPMGLEGAVRFAFRKQLEELTDEREQAEFFDARVADIYAAGQALSVARFLEIDAVIDPADTRSWIIGGADAARAERAATPKKRPFVDTW
jgi:acetyl-CoA carboxylase carboxyltransferase component